MEDQQSVSTTCEIYHNLTDKERSNACPDMERHLLWPGNVSEELAEKNI